MHGAVRREEKVLKIVSTIEDGGELTPRERSVALGAARLGILEGTRGLLFMPDTSPSRRIAMESYWGMEGTRNG